VTSLVLLPIPPKANLCRPEIIPKFILLLTNNRHLPVHGSGTNTRRYLHASDAADAFDTILHRGSIGQIYNIGSSDEVSNLALCRKLLDIFHQPCSSDLDLEKWVTHTQDRPFNDRRYAIDTSKLKMLGWRQKVDFQDGLESTVAWYKQYGSWWWGDVEGVLTPFPVAVEENVTRKIESKADDAVTDV
jgi:dTDP-D-glucose 4,6-dehydratase